jgi:tetraprenyl-beta-curcumene synthase
VRAAARETAAALAALGAYAGTVLPGVRRELRRWRRAAEAIPDPSRRRLALAALEEKSSNVEAVAVFATLAPLRRRRAALRSIVPLQLGIDYLDSLEEAGDGGGWDGDGYLAALRAGWTREAEALPSCAAVIRRLCAAVDRCGEGQRRTHAAGSGDPEGLRRWAGALEAPGYRWWEAAAGASSSVAAHALIAAAADPATTAESAARIDVAYHPPVGALTVFLDDLVDRERDRAAGEHNYLDYYESPAEAAERLAVIARRAEALIEPLPQAARHRAILAGVGAFYLSADELDAAEAGQMRKRLLAALGPGTRILTAFMRMRRGRRNRPGRAGGSPGP